MKKLKGKIILIDDEPFEMELLKRSLCRLGLEADLEYFDDAEKAFEYLSNTEDLIFIIMCDLNMPRMNGLELKKLIDTTPGLSEKAIPFIFSTSGVTRAQLEECYEYRVQGYFIKPDDVEQMARQLQLIIHYWVVSIRPDSEKLGKQEKIFNLKQ